MGSSAFFCRGLLAYAVMGVLFGLAANPVWALGPGAPPIIREAYVYVRNNNNTYTYLDLTVQVEVPGGRVPQDIASVTVLVPGEGGPRVVPRAIADLPPDNNFSINLTEAGVAGFPLGTYTFTVTDTAGGVATATDTLTSATPLAATTITSQVENQIIAPASPTIIWTPVAGAAIYRVVIRNGYMDWNLFSHYTTGTSVTLPSGVLGPGRRWQIRVDAFDHVNGYGCGTPGCTSMDTNAMSVRRIQVDTQGPDVFLTFPQGPYTNGQTLNLTARVWNTHAPVTVDAVVWIGIPGSSAPIEVLEFTNVLLPQNLAGDVYSGPLGFSYTFTGAEPNGVYVVGFRLLDPVSKETIAVTTRTFTKS